MSGRFNPNSLFGCSPIEQSDRRKEQLIKLKGLFAYDPNIRHQKELHETRIDIKTLERLFANVITEGTNCSPFESDIIVEKAKEVFAIGNPNPEYFSLVI